MAHTIGFIGSGAIASALARLSLAAGLNVVISNSRGPDTLAELVQELGDHARAATPEEASRAGDLVVLATPLNAYDKLPVQSLGGKIVIDTMNYYPIRDGQIPVLDSADLTSSQLIQQHLKGAKLVKALNNLDSSHLFINARSDDRLNRTTLPVAGDDFEAKQAVMEFVDTIGYNAIDIGSLSESWRVEPGTPIHVWPYVPKVPAGLADEEAQDWFKKAPGTPVSEPQAKDLVAKAVRNFPVGGFPEYLPPVLIAISVKHGRLPVSAKTNPTA
jgi:8-hydroxy-5-deazaflavin:NADPH oxidoreductase